jgi:ABC-2 type transport system ATP-binding protein
MTIEPIITVENLTKRYRKAKINAVDDISFSVDPGEFFAFLGPNGAGKTTTISILTTTLAKTGGKVSIAGYDLDKQSKFVRQNIGIIFQNPSLDLNLTAEENIRFHCSLYGLYSFRPSYRLMPQSYKDRVLELSQVLGLGEEIFKPIKTFSGGMKRKLEIIRSLMHRPKILFLDEPTSGLDPISRSDLWEYLQKVRQEEGTTVFLTTHYLEEAEGASRVCVVSNGKIITLGTPDEIKRELIDEFVQVDAEDRKKLEHELKGAGFKYDQVDKGFKVYFDGATPQAVINAIKIPLTTLKVNTPSLEEAYVKLLDDQAKAESMEKA